VFLVLFAGAFWIRAGRGRPVGARTESILCDSVRAVNLVIDSVATGYSFPSQVLRFARERHRVRIVTMPASQSRVTDGMTVAYVDDQCRITSLVQTDSA
jgi:hypothetical protein